MNRPFLKWAGNKYQVIDKILKHLPPGKRLIEPFVGSGAVFLNTNYESYLLADANEDLINLYQLLQHDGENFIDYCHQFYHSKANTKENYLSYRTLFNETTDKKLKAALFIYLNRHGFNGLCRYNSSGKFNVPFGTYVRKPTLPVDRMLQFQQKSQQVEFRQQNFLDTLSQAKKGDIVYCDPPYVPLSNTANFTSYHKLQFGETEQIALANVAKKLSRKGVHIIISNHDLPFTREIYAGAHFESFNLQRLISSDSQNRNWVKELISIF